MWNQTFEHPMIIITPREYSTVRLWVESGVTPTERTPQSLRTSLSYLRVFWRTAQQSFTSLCFCTTRAASAGCRFESWETLTSSIWNHTERQENKRRRQAGVWHGAGPTRLGSARSQHVTIMGCEFWITHHDLTGNVPNFPVSAGFHSMACREAFSLDEK